MKYQSIRVSERLANINYGKINFVVLSAYLSHDGLRRALNDQTGKNIAWPALMASMLKISGRSPNRIQRMLLDLVLYLEI